MMLTLSLTALEDCGTRLSFERGRDRILTIVKSLRAHTEMLSSHNCLVPQSGFPYLKVLTLGPKPLLACQTVSDQQPLSVYLLRNNTPNH